MRKLEAIIGNKAIFGTRSRHHQNQGHLKAFPENIVPLVELRCRSDQVVEIASIEKITFGGEATGR